MVVIAKQKQTLVSATNHAWYKFAQGLLRIDLVWQSKHAKNAESKAFTYMKILYLCCRISANFPRSERVIH